MAVMIKVILPVAVVLLVFGVVQCKRDHCSDLAKYSRHYVSSLDDMCYMFVGEEMYWDDARDHCWKLGGEMIVIDSQRIMDHIRTVLNTRRVPWNNKGVWIGASYQENRGWRWTTGKKVDYGYWADGQPGKTLGYSIENCACMRRGDGWKWHDYHCHLLRYHYNFICQFRGASENNQEAQTGGSESVDNGNTLILGIMIGTACLIILIVVLGFFIYRYFQKKKYSRDFPPVLYGNESFTDINASTESPALYQNRPRPVSDIYITPAEVNTLYEDVNKPSNHGNNHLNNITCPLLLSDSLQQPETERQAAEGSSIEPISALEGAQGRVRNSDVSSQPGPSNIPSIMETSTRSVNEYVEMSCGAGISPPKPCAVQDTKVRDANSYCKPIISKEVPIYGNVECADNEENSIYEELP